MSSDESEEVCEAMQDAVDVNDLKTAILMFGKLATEKLFINRTHKEKDKFTSLEEFMSMDCDSARIPPEKSSLLRNHVSLYEKYGKNLLTIKFDDIPKQDDIDMLFYLDMFCFIFTDEMNTEMKQYPSIKTLKDWRHKGGHDGNLFKADHNHITSIVLIFFRVIQEITDKISEDDARYLKTYVSDKVKKWPVHNLISTVYHMNLFQLAEDMWQDPLFFGLLRDTEKLPQAGSHLDYIIKGFNLSTIHDSKNARINFKDLADTILNESPDCDDRKIFMIYGDVGCGKTSFCYSIVHLWCRKIMKIKTENDDIENSDEDFGTWIKDCYNNLKHLNKLNEFPYTGIIPIDLTNNSSKTFYDWLDDNSEETSFFMSYFKNGCDVEKDFRANQVLFIFDDFDPGKNMDLLNDCLRFRKASFVITCAPCYQSIVDRQLGCEASYFLKGFDLISANILIDRALSPDSDQFSNQDVEVVQEITELNEVHIQNIKECDYINGFIPSVNLFIFIIILLLNNLKRSECDASVRQLTRMIGFLRDCYDLTSDTILFNMYEKAYQCYEKFEANKRFCFPEVKLPQHTFLISRFIIGIFSKHYFTKPEIIENSDRLVEDIKRVAKINETCSTTRSYCFYLLLSELEPYCTEGHPLFSLWIFIASNICIIDTQKKHSIWHIRHQNFESQIKVLNYHAMACQTTADCFEVVLSTGQEFDQIASVLHKYCNKERLNKIVVNITKDNKDVEIPESFKGLVQFFNKLVLKGSMSLKNIDICVTNLDHRGTNLEELNVDIYDIDTHNELVNLLVSLNYKGTFKIIDHFTVTRNVVFCPNECGCSFTFDNIDKTGKKWLLHSIEEKRSLIGLELRLNWSRFSFDEAVFLCEEMEEKNVQIGCLEFIKTHDFTEDRKQEMNDKSVSFNFARTVEYLP